MLLIPFSRMELLLPHEEGEERLETYPHLPEICGRFGGGTLPFQSDFSVSPHVGPPPHQDEGIQMK